MDIKSIAGSTFNFDMQNEITKKLDNQGVNYLILNPNPTHSATFNQDGNCGVKVQTNASSVPYGCTGACSYSYTTNHYFEIVNDNTPVVFTTSVDQGSAEDGYSLVNASANLYDINGNLLSMLEVQNCAFGGTPPGCPGTASQNFCLQKGIYKIETGFYTTLVSSGAGSAGVLINHQAGLNIAGNSYMNTTVINGCAYTEPIAATEDMKNPTFSIQPSKKMLFSAWVHENCANPCNKTDFSESNIEIWSGGVNIGANKIKRTGTIIDGWQKIEGEFTAPSGVTTAQIKFINSNPNAPMYVDDIRIHPFNANMKTYVYDPVNLRLTAELDENNYAKFYEYNEEGTLVRTKAETKEGIKTITETRSATQKEIKTFQ